MRLNEWLRNWYLRASASKNAILFFFTISKSNFITFNIPFYNTSYIKKLYYFIFSLKYYFLIFFLLFLSHRHFFFRIPTVKFSWAFELFFFFFQTCILQQSHFSWAMQHYFFSNSDVDSSGLSLWPLSFLSNNLLFFQIQQLFQTTCHFFFFFERTCNFFYRKNMPNINILKTCKL